MLLATIDWIGSLALELCTVVGDFFCFFAYALKTAVTTPLNVKQVLIHMKRIGVDSCTIIFLTGLSAGLALALQTNIGFSRFGAQEFIGTIVALGMTRELGPVLTGLMVTGRAGSAMAAEIGTMSITEQIDALKTLCINPFQYLIVPRLLASTFILPFLTIFSMMCGVIGGYIFFVFELQLNPEVYIASIEQYVELSDIVGGLIKSSCFGCIMAWVGTFHGYRTIGGAKGVGTATTRSVVIASILVLISNYFLSSLLHTIGVS